MKERRKFERFPLTLPARMEMITSNKRQVFDLETWDISAAGAFILTSKKFPQGSRFKLNLTVSSDKIKEITGARSLIECKGSVVRSSDTGMAVRFNGNYQILGLNGL
ncbi:MAG: PilZ domain-containing protein [Thermodesulfobacteriota bacterium]|nr:PilZ domain-containing protein [Thermodesulfobacteriota bacterium]